VVVRIECWTDLWYRLISSVYQLLKYKILRSPTLVGNFSARVSPEVEYENVEGTEPPRSVSMFRFD